MRLHLTAYILNPYTIRLRNNDTFHLEHYYGMVRQLLKIFQEGLDT